MRLPVLESLLARRQQAAAEAQQRLRQQGVEQAHSALVGQLCYVVSVHQLLSEESARVPRKWQRAFARLFPLCGEYRQFDENAVSQDLQAFGFSAREADFLVTRRTKCPEILVTMLVCVLSGIPEPEVWGVTENL